MTHRQRIQRKRRRVRVHTNNRTNAALRQLAAWSAEVWTEFSRQSETDHPAVSRLLAAFSR